MSAISSVQTGNNAELIKAVAELYAEDGMTVADVTYGKGAFWRKVDTSRYHFLATDLFTPTTIKADFTALPLRSGSVDVLVFDPPYVHNPGKLACDKTYNNAQSSKGMYHADIMREFYSRGITEAARVVKPEGQIWVKCKDEVESGTQKWSHIEIYEIAQKLDLLIRDLFVLIPTSQVNNGRWSKQLHARKNHSYLWIFTVRKKA